MGQAGGQSPPSASPPGFIKLAPRPREILQNQSRSRRSRWRAGTVPAGAGFPSGRRGRGGGVGWDFDFFPPLFCFVLNFFVLFFFFFFKQGGGRLQATRSQTQHRLSQRDRDPGSGCACPPQASPAPHEHPAPCRGEESHPPREQTPAGSGSSEHGLPGTPSPPPTGMGFWGLIFGAGPRGAPLPSPLPPLST